MIKHSDLSLCHARTHYSRADLPIFEWKLSKASYPQVLWTGAHLPSYDRSAVNGSIAEATSEREGGYYKMTNYDLQLVQFCARARCRWKKQHIPDDIAKKCQDHKQCLAQNRAHTDSLTITQTSVS